MYHYVRPKNFSNIQLNSLDSNMFEKQIRFLKNKSNIITNLDFEEMLKTKKVPRKSCTLLTFDDGYVDHYKFVLPILLKYKIKGNFYIPQDIIERKKILTVNKIHYILSKSQNKKKLLHTINDILFKKFKKKLEDFKIDKILLTSRFDTKETTLIKKLLQYYLPKKIRIFIVNHLFIKIFGNTEEELSKKLYMNSKNIQDLLNNDMTIGIHGKTHSHLSKMNYIDQEKEIKSSINFLNKFKLKKKNFSICYPYGSYNNETLKIAKKNDLAFGLTTTVGFINKDNLKKKLELPRFNANDLKI